MKLGAIIEAMQEWGKVKQEKWEEMRGIPGKSFAKEGAETEVYLEIRISARKIIKVPLEVYPAMFRGSDTTYRQQGGIHLQVDIRDELAKSVRQRQHLDTKE